MAFGIVSSRYRRKGSGQPTTIDGAMVVQDKGKTYYVDANVGTGGDGLSWEAAFKTMQACFNVLVGGETIHLAGKIREQLVTPVQIFDVKIVGNGNRPRHADSTPSGGEKYAATWMAPASGAVVGQANVRVLQQGWRFENILFAMEGSTAAGIELVRDAAAGNSERDASHAHIIGCKFAGAGVGIRCGVSGTFTEIPNHVVVEHNVFIDNTYAIRGQIQGQRWSIKHNEFQANTNHITAQLGASFIYDNIFGAFTAAASSGGIDLSGGQGLNIVTMNYLSGTFSNAGGYVVANADDEWAGNFNTISSGTDRAGVTVADPA